MSRPLDPAGKQQMQFESKLQFNKVQFYVFKEQTAEKVEVVLYN